MRVASLAIASLLTGACGYTSSYVPPLDGRARVVYRDSDARMETAGAALSDDCSAEVAEALGERPRRRLVRAPGEGAPVVGTYWAPIYYGPSIVVVTPGVPPLLPTPPLYSPSLALARATSQGALHLRSPSLGVSGGGGGGGMKLDNGSGQLLVVLAVVALIVLPTIDVALALASPESSSVSSSAIDRVNAYNDLARTPGTACSGVPAYGPPTGAPPPPPSEMPPPPPQEMQQ